VNDARYTSWIEDYLVRHNNFVRGKCDEATVEMVEAFPELRRACGFVFCSWGEDTHWWCVAPDGSVIDPTKAQFNGLVFSYEEIDPKKPHRPLPTGPCGTCRNYVYDGTMFCSTSCAREFAHDCGVAYVERPELGEPIDSKDVSESGDFFDFLDTSEVF
jgi:hypothetical protein